MRNRLTKALKGARAWNRGYRGLPLILGAVMLLWIGLWIIDLPAIHSIARHWTEEWEEQHDSSSEAYEASHFQWTRRYPTILFVDFDQASVERATQAAPPGERPTLKADLATILGWLHADRRARPALVFVDLSPLGEPNPADESLAKAIHGWADDPNSAPLAIFAGVACRTSNASEPSKPLGPSLYSADVLPGSDGSYAARPATGKIIWSCPIYDRMIERNYWYCAEANDLGQVAALLSPGWFAAAVKEAGQGFLGSARTDLAAAARACLGNQKHLEMGDRHVEVARSNRVTLTFDPADVNKGEVDGNPVVSKLPAVELLGDLAAGSPPASIFDGKIVVVGSTARFRGQDDQISTRFGDVPGSVIVAEELRSGWAMGYPRGENWWASQMVATLLVVGVFFLFRRASTVKERWGRGASPRAKLVVLVTNLHVMYLAIIPVLSWLTFQLGQLLFDLDWYKIAFAFALTEVLVIGTSVVQELHGEDQEDRTPSPHADGRDRGASGAEGKPG